MKSSRLLVVCLALVLAASPVWAIDGMIGLGAGVAPDYEGSDDTKAVPYFLFSHNYDSGRFVKLNGPNLKVNLLADVSDSHDGYTVQGSAGYRWKVMPTLTLTPGAFMTYASEDYMSTYFSVNSHNRGSSNLSSYSADSGIKDVGLNLVGHYAPWEHWGIMGLVSYKKLLNDAKDSPIVDDEGNDNQMNFGLMGTYRWK